MTMERPSPDPVVWQATDEQILIEVGGHRILTEAACPHRKGRLRFGHINGRALRITCPLHHSTFDLLTGRVISGPACRPLRVTVLAADARFPGGKGGPVTTVDIDPHADPRDPRLPDSADTIVVFSDLNCSFAHLAVHRLHETRKRLGLEGRIWLDHRGFPLELFNDNVNARPGVDSEISVVGALDPAAGWRLWQGPDWEYPVTTLPPLEAVQAAKEQGWRASEQLDRALRRAHWAQGRCISMRHEILAIARETGALDVTALAEALDSGRARRAVMDQFEAARHGRVNCSPHVFLFDGTNLANPGVSVRWVNGRFGVGFPVIDEDDPTVYESLLQRATSLAAAAKPHAAPTGPARG